MLLARVGDPVHLGQDRGRVAGAALEQRRWVKMTSSGASLWR